MYPAKPANSGSTQKWDPAAASMDLARETSTVVHPLATQALWAHVDFRFGSSGLGALLVLTWTGVSPKGAGSTTNRDRFGVDSVGDVAAQRTCVAMCVSWAFLKFWTGDLWMYFCWIRIDILRHQFGRMPKGKITHARET